VGAEIRLRVRGPMLGGQEACMHACMVIACVMRRKATRGAPLAAVSFRNAPVDDALVTMSSSAAVLFDVVVVALEEAPRDEEEKERSVE
jgi:hypothetical protein